MSTYDQAAALGIGMPLKGLKVYTIENEVDLDLAADGVAPVATDIIKVLRIPKGSIVLAAGLIPQRIAVGTTLTLTFDETSGKGLNLGGTAAAIAASTAMAVGVVAPATVTTGGVTGKTSSTEAEDVYMTVTITTATAVTDFGKQKYFAVVAKVD